jgi:hypothetical protein
MWTRCLLVGLLATLTGHDHMAHLLSQLACAVLLFKVVLTNSGSSVGSFRFHAGASLYSANLRLFAQK